MSVSNDRVYWALIFCFRGFSLFRLSDQLPSTNKDCVKYLFLASNSTYPKYLNIFIIISTCVSHTSKCKTYTLHVHFVCIVQYVLRNPPFWFVVQVMSRVWGSRRLFSYHLLNVMLFSLPVSMLMLETTTGCPCPYYFCCCCHGRRWCCCCHGRRWYCCCRGRRGCCCCHGRRWCCSCKSVRLANPVWISTMTELSNSTKQVSKPNHFFVQT